MNNPDPYDRRTDRSLHEALNKSPESESAERSTEHLSGLSALAVHRDPSQPTPDTPGVQQKNGKRSIVWVRPSDLPTVTGTPWVRRGIDLQAELTRRARRAPARAGRRITRTAIARPETTQATTTTSTSREGLEL